MHVLRCSRVGSVLTNSFAPRSIVGRQLHRGAAALAFIAVAIAGACKQAEDPAKVATIAGMNPVDSVRLGKTFGFDIQTRDAAGNKLTGRKVTWTSLNPNVATVDANGVVTGVALGSTVITARADGASSQTDMRVQPLVASVVLAPSSTTLPVGANRTLNVTVSDKDGLALAGRLISFSTSNPAVATVNASGTVVGVSVGQAVITAQAVQDQVSGTSTIQVVQVPVARIDLTPAGSQTVFQGLTLQFAATLRDGSGNILNGRTVSWTTSNPSIATVSSSGLVTGIALGNVQITAESEGVVSSATVTVVPRPVATVGLSPNPGNVKMGSQLQMTLDLRDSNGNQLTTVGRTVLWDSSNKPVATVQDGVVSGVTQGSATVTVTVDGKPASAIVNVTP